MLDTYDSIIAVLKEDGYDINRFQKYIVDHIDDRISYLIDYADDEWALDSMDIDYSIYEKFYEDFDDYVDCILDEENPEIAVVLKEVSSKYDFLHEGLSDEAWKSLERKYKVAPTNAAKRLVDYCTNSYKAAYDNAYNRFFYNIVVATIEEEIRDLVGEVDC